MMRHSIKFYLILLATQHADFEVTITVQVDDGQIILIKLSNYSWQQKQRTIASVRKVPLFLLSKSILTQQVKSLKP